MTSSKDWSFFIFGQLSLANVASFINELAAPFNRYQLSMQPFVSHDSVVRKIWGRADTVLFIFAGAAAEFALNKSVDWLYFTGRLPADPLNRLFSTVTYAHRIIFSETDGSHRAIDQMSSIHAGVEKARGYQIPAWAYRDVLYLLIYYSQSAFELLDRKMTNPEKEELFDVFFRVGARMGLRDLPSSYEEWLVSREQHLNTNLECSSFTVDLFKQYRVHLGSFRYKVLVEVQKLIVPPRVRQMLGFNSIPWIRPLITLYIVSRKLGADRIFRTLILPAEFRQQVDALDRN
jgi:uncharacterized protein (DUF2236 family)